MLFSLNDSSSIPEHFFKPALCTYYALITSSLALIVCYWCEIFFTEDAAHGAAKRWVQGPYKPWMTDVLGLDFWQNLVLLLRFSIHFYLVYYWSILLLRIFMNPFPISHRIWFFQHYLQQVPYPNLKWFSISFSVLLIVHIMFLVVGVEIYCKIRGAFVSEKSEIANVDKVQAIHSRLGLFFQVSNAKP